MPRLMLFAATTGYQLREFAEAARRLGADVRFATDRCRRMEDPWGDRALPVRFGDTRASRRLLRMHSFDAVAAVGDGPAVLAAEAAADKRIPFHPPAAARACHNKFLAREIYRQAGLRVPAYFRALLEADEREIARRAPYPCVLKPLGLSASRGVIRADDPAAFVRAFARIRALLADPDIRRAREEQNRYLQVEEYIPGREFAVEALMVHGRLEILALFDKPDPLEGPYFEETIYVTPARLPEADRREVETTLRRAVEALGLRHGPVHAELRLNAGGAWMLEAAARPIGGLCARALRFNGGVPLEELILRHALGGEVTPARLDGPASGVMMVPIPRGGVYQGVSGVDRAAAVTGIEEVVITAKEGQQLVPLPEGASYLGFLFARAETPGAVEGALRRAHAELDFRIAAALATMRPQPFERGGT